jgi:hypothetical protein
MDNNHLELVYAVAYIWFPDLAVGRLCTRKIYNVVDDDSASRTEVMSYARDLLNSEGIDSCKAATEGMPPAADMARGGRIPLNRAGEKRVLNKRIRLELKISLLYPTYKSGLKAILSAFDKGRKQVI